MKRAIVLGSTGYIGSAVVKSLIDENILVLAIGRRSFDEAQKILPLESDKVSYVQIHAENITQLVKWKKWANKNETVFFNFLWSGDQRLTDGKIADQLENVTLSSNAIKVSKEIGCIKYINVGTQDEALLESCLKVDWKFGKCHTNSIYYTNSKLISRDMSTLIAYMEKIDYIHTRFSLAVDSELLARGYLAESLKILKNGGEIEPVKNKQLYDLIDLHDLACAYVAIGKYGKNKANYFIGTGNPKSLTEFFSLFLDFKNNTNLTKIKTSPSKSEVQELFDTNLLFEDTGFKIKRNFKEISKRICKL